MSILNLKRWRRANYLSSKRKREIALWQVFLISLAMEEEITNDQLFYMLFGYYYGNSDINTMYLDNIRNAVDRGTRKRQHINDKLKWANAIFNLVGTGTKDSLRTRMDKYRANDDMTIVGFSVAKTMASEFAEIDDKTDDSFRAEGRIGCELFLLARGRLCVRIGG